MADIREEALKRLVVIAAGVQGIVAADRNKSDVPENRRPAVLIQDGSEQFVSAPRSETLMRAQMMELSPAIWIRVNTKPEEAGPLLSVLRNRLMKAISADAALQAIITSNGYLRFEGSTVPEPPPQGFEQRMDLNVVIGYPFRLVDV